VKFIEKIFTPQLRIYYGGILLFIALLALFLFPSEAIISAGLFLAASILLLVFLVNLRWGIYLMAVFCFFTNWFVYLNQYDFFKNVAYVTAVNAPLIDFIAMVVGFSIGLAWILQLYPIHWREFLFIKRIMIGYGLLVVWSILCAMRAFEHQVGLSVKYVARPMIFVFLLFLIIPLIIVRTRQIFNKVLQIWFGVGIVIALFGLSSLVVVPQNGWWRVTPYGINDIAPLGYNHNLIAEALIPLIPIAAWFMVAAYRRHEKKWIWYGVGGGLIILAELLTLSRAGWIALGVQAIIVGWWYRAQLRRWLVHKAPQVTWVLVMLAIPVIMYMAIFIRSSVTKSSNVSRYTMLEITIFYAERSPVIGYGPGMFIPLFTSTRDYVTEFGDALESHGFLQKLLLETGIPGVSLFVLILGDIVLLLRRATLRVRYHQEVLLMGLVMVAGAISFQLFNTSYFTSVMWMPIGIALAGARLYYYESAEADKH
jgi:hypothetical protein